MCQTQDTYMNHEKDPQIDYGFADEMPERVGGQAIGRRGK